MNDEQILNIMFIEDKVNPNKVRKSWLEKHKQIKEYLEKRFEPEPFMGYTYVLYCIKLKYKTLPKCKNKNCGKILNRYNKKYCSVKCQLTDEDFIKTRNNKIDWDARTKKMKQTFQNKYGYEITCSFQLPENQKKSHSKDARQKASQTYKETCLNKYGVANYFETEECKIKSKKTKFDKYGDMYYNNVPKIQQTHIEKYGVKTKLENSIYRDEMVKKAIEKNPNFYKENAKKSSITKKEKYGNSTYNNSNKNKATCLKKYGFTSYAQTEEFHKKKYKKFEYDEKKFDSSYELVFYIYCKDKGLEIEQEPCKLEYEFEGKKHYYFPDFRVNGELVELKGKQFFKDGVLINPYDSEQDGLYKAKFECMKLHKVKIITEIKKYKEYVKNQYGEKFIELCKK